MSIFHKTLCVCVCVCVCQSVCVCVCVCVHIHMRIYIKYIVSCTGEYQNSGQRDRVMSECVAGSV